MRDHEDEDPGSNTCESADCAKVDLCQVGQDRYRTYLEAGSAGTSDVPTCVAALGLMEPEPSRPDRMVPVAPEVALDRSLDPIQHRASMLREQARQLYTTFGVVESIYEEARKRSLPPVTVIRGSDLIAQTITSATDACQTELMTAQPGSRRPPEILEAALLQNRALLSRGVQQRTLYQHAVRSDQATFNYITEVVSSGGEVRTVDEIFDRLVICDRSAAYIPIGPSYADEALEVRHPAIIRFLVNVFDSVWSSGIPVELESHRRPTAVVGDTERAVVRLLVDGHTEMKIARKLGISRRTVAEHVSRISHRLGSNSRTQLGYLIAVNDLIRRG